LAPGADRRSQRFGFEGVIGFCSAIIVLRALPAMTRPEHAVTGVGGHLQPTTDAESRRWTITHDNVFPTTGRARGLRLHPFDAGRSAAP